ncbi:MAG: HD domain-containing protein [Alphaproteobacteria bacterium]|nr:HD domain-containing protein [Alphaproteobacteria bacterium]
MSWDKLVKNQASKLDKKSDARILFAVSNPSRFREILPSLQMRSKVTSIDQGWAAVEHGALDKYDAAIVESNMPALSGYEIVQRINEERKAKNLAPLPILFVNDPESHDLQTDVVSEFCKGSIAYPFNSARFLGQFWQICDDAAEKHWKDLNFLQQSVLKVTKNSIKKMFEAQDKNAIIKPELYKDCTQILVEAAASKDLTDVVSILKQHHSYTFVHVLKVSSLMTIFGSELSLNKTDMELLAQGGLMHDVGKRHTPVELLEKPSKLDDDEWVVMKEHVNISGSILRASPDIPKEVIQIAERHHEKLDGSGYPHGLKGAQMDDLSLIAAIMDIYSALTDKRSYKPSMSATKALEIMDTMAGHHIEEGFYKRFKEMVLDGAMGDV